MKKLLLIPTIFVLAGCATTDWTAVGSDLVTDFNQGLLTADDAFAAYTALNQNLTTANVTTGKLDVTKVLSAGAAIQQTATASPGLATAVEALVADANQTIADLKGKPVTAVIAAASQQGAASITTVAALNN